MPQLKDKDWLNGYKNKTPIYAVYKRPESDPWVKKAPWRREWQPTPVFLLGESHGQRSLVGYSPLGHKESDMTKQLTTNRTMRFIK